MVKKFKVIKKKGMAKRVVRRGGDISVEEGSDTIIKPSIDDMRKKQEQEILNGPAVQVEAPVLPTKVEVPYTNKNVVLSDKDIVKKVRDTGDFQNFNQPEVVLTQQVVQTSQPQSPQPVVKIPEIVTQKTFLQKLSDKFSGTPKTEEEKKNQERIPNDKMAIKGGSQYVYSTIKNEELAIKESEEKIKEELGKLEDEESTYSEKLENARKNFEDLDKLIDMKKETIKNYETSQDYKNDMKQLTKYRTDFNFVNNRKWRIADDKEKVQKELKNIDRLKRLNQEKLAKYDRAIKVGELESKKESGWRQEAKSFSDNATSMIGAPIISQPDVGYGTPNVSQGFNKIISTVSVGPNANAWARTRSGDRALVEDLVRVNQNRMITPFGVPGTVAGGNTSKQFAYNIPLNKIGVGDVTARGGYKINIEDIRRKKSQKIASKPIIIRKKIKKSVTKKANITSIGGNLNIDIPKSLVVANISKQKPMKLNIDVIPKTEIGNFNKNMKLNMSPISINADKPQGSSVKLNVDSGVIPYTFKNIEVNLNNVSNSVKKKMKVKS